jgi:hypothetical protein
MTLLGRPWRANQYFTVKITSCSNSDRELAETEIKISEHISKVKTQHASRRYVRLIEDSFTIEGHFGQHICLALEPLRQSLDSLHVASISWKEATSIPALQNSSGASSSRPGLLALCDCHIIHTGKDLKVCSIHHSFTNTLKT